ncbi:hypothetical protein NGA35_12035, partial [Pseudomonas stutzeri]|nr:hypothetical protein [Stutzerimonas stutzeri]
TTPTPRPSSQALDLQGFFDQLVAGSGAHYRRLRAGVNDFLQFCCREPQTKQTATLAQQTADWTDWTQSA